MFDSTQRGSVRRNGSFKTAPSSGEGCALQRACHCHPIMMMMVVNIRYIKIGKHNCYDISYDTEI